MTNRHKILRNRVFDFSFKEKINQSTFDLVDALNTDILEIVNTNLLKRPKTTINYLMTIEPDLKWCQDFLLNEVSFPVQKKIMRKEQLTELEGHNFENGSELYWRLEEIIDVINTSIESVKPKQDKKKVNPPPKTLEIEIDTSIIETVLEGLKPHFDERDHEKLKKVLNGNKIEGQITFRGNKNQLPELLKRLEYNDLIKNPLDKTDLVKWLTQNFTTFKGAYIFDTLNKWLTSTDFYIRKERRICKDIPTISQEGLVKRNKENKK